MACTTDKFVINKSMSNEFIITIKQNDSTLPMAIDPIDTFTVNFYNLETQELEFTVGMTETADGQVVIHSNINGQILITLTAIAVGGLLTERGDKVDKYYLKPTYRMAIDCNTVNNGKFVAKIDSVYIEG